MLGETLGPYRLVAELGSGGMGTVYLAETVEARPGVEAGRRVAVKVIHPQLLGSPGILRRFLREAEIGRTVVHPNVVRTLDAGTAEVGGKEVPWLAMEYVQGQTLREVLQEEGLLAEELCRHVGREVARALEAVHAAGVVHRDLKPENVLITQGQEIRLMDLGVARLQDEVTRLTRTGVFVGSMNFAAPEQLREGGADVDGRADLFSLGVLLYEVSTGTHPFGKGDIAALLRRVLFEDPRRASEANPGLTPFFEEVVHRLLAKDREKRFPTARDLLDVLTEGEQCTWWRCRAHAIQKETRRPLRRIRVPRETPLVARDAELERLAGLWREAKEGRGQVVLVEGEAGIGKSRLLDEFLLRLEREGEDFNGLAGAYPPVGVPSGAGAVATAYREFLGDQGLEEALRGCLTGSTALVPGLAAFLRGESAPRGEATLSREALGEAVVRITRHLAGAKPTLVLIDDLHFAHDEGRALFATLAYSLAGERVMLVGTAGLEIPRAWTAAMEQLPNVARLPLSRLGGEDIAVLLREALGSDRLAEELRDRVLRKSDGNPLFAFEILRGLREGRFLAKEQDGTWVKARPVGNLTIPSSVLDLIHVRLSELGDEDRDILDVGSCFGYEFDPLVVGDVVGMPAVPLLKRLGRLERDHRLVRSVGMRCVFDNHQVQEALYGGLSELLRREYHGAIAGSLERRAGAAGKDPEDLDGALAVSLADHFLKGGRAEDALRVVDRALDHLEESRLNEAAVDLAARVAAIPGLLSREKRLVILIRKSERLELLGLWEEERKTLEEALLEADAAGDPRARASVRRRLGNHFSRHDRFEEARASLEAALDLARKAADPKEEAEVLHALGVVSWHLGRIEEARGYHDRTGEVSGAAGLPEGEAGSTGNLTEVYLSLGLPREARRTAERQLGAARRLGDRRAEAAATGRLAGLHHDHGDLAPARDLFEKALEMAREAGDRRLEARSAVSLGAVLRDLGRFAESTDRLRSALSLCREIGYRRGEARTHGHLAGLSRDLGRAAEAMQHARRHLQIARDLRTRAEEAQALLGVGVLHLDAGEAAEAGEALEESRRLSLSLAPSLARTLAEAHLALARLGFAAERGEEAARHLEEASSLAESSGAADPAVLAAVLRAVLGGGDLWKAREFLDGHAGRMRLPEDLEARFLLGRAAEDGALLRDARRILDDLVARSPADLRAGMVRSVPLYRAVLEATGDFVPPAP